MCVVRASLVSEKKMFRWASVFDEKVLSFFVGERYNISSLQIVYPVRLGSRVDESSRDSSVSYVSYCTIFLLHACGFICMCHNNFPARAYVM